MPVTNKSIKKEIIKIMLENMTLRILILKPHQNIILINIIT